MSKTSSHQNKPLSRLDQFVAYFADKLDFFPKGWGDLRHIEPFQNLRPGHRHDGSNFEITWTSEKEDKHAFYRQGFFESPFQFPYFPQECQQARVELILPKRTIKTPPICLQLAATGDQKFHRRRNLLAIPLAQQGIASLLLENPFYGNRRPSTQKGFSLNQVTDLWFMGNAVISEGRALLNWLKESGFDKRCVTGVSMGGYMSALIASEFPEKIATVPCIAPHSGVPVFTEGVLMKACNWKVLSESLTPDKQAQERMRELLESTDIRHFSAPQFPEAAIIVAGQYDAYIPAYSPQILHNHWPGSEIRWLPTGHVGAFFFYRDDFIKAIADAITRL